MDDLKSELRDAFQRRMDAAPMRPDLAARVAQRIAEPSPRREPLVLATAMAVVFVIAVVGTFLYLSSSQRTHSTPAASPAPAASPSSSPTPSPAASPAATQPAPRFQPYSFLRANANAGFITTGPDGAPWFDEAGPPANYIARVSTSGAITEHPVTTPVSYPQSLVAGPDGAIWFTEQSGRIGRMSVAGQLTEYTLSTPDSVPEGITVGPDGALWFTQRGANTIGRITTSGQATEFPLPDRHLSSTTWPARITAGPDGALWFTEPGLSLSGGNRIGRITVRGQLSEFSIPTTDAMPAGIVSGKDGNLWFSERQGRAIGRISTSGQITEFPISGLPDDGVINGLTAGPGGDVWFTTGTVGTSNFPQLGQLGRIAPDGTVTLTTFPDGAIPGQIATGPQGTLWALSDTRIWKITIN